MRQYCAEEIAALPISLLNLEQYSISLVMISQGLRDLAQELEQIAR